MKDAKSIKQIFSEIDFRNGQYIIDHWQRDYEWDKTQWQNLLDTIEKINLINITNKWIGNFICFYPDEHNAFVVDGQQRLTTITIIMSVIRDLASEIDNSTRLKSDIDRNLLDRDRRNYIVYKNNSETDKVYSSIIKGNFNQLQTDYKNNAFYKAYKFYASCFKNYDIEQLENIFNKISNLVININICENYEEALETFENVNGKGKHVSTNDNIKTKICKIIHNSNLSDYDKNSKTEQINSITKKLKDGNGKSFYCRYYYHMTGIWKKKTEIYNILIKYLTSINQVNDIFDLYDYEQQYNNFYTFHHQSLTILYNDFKKYDIPQIQQHIITNTMANILIKNIINGDGVGFLHEEVFCGVIEKIKNNGLIDLPINEISNKIIEFIIGEQQIYKKELEIISDEMLKNKLLNYDLYKANNGLCLYILWKLNEYFEIQSNNNEHIKIDNPTIDHIDAQTNNSKYTNTLGNLTLLSQSANSSKNKKNVTNADVYNKFANSSLKINKDLISHYDLLLGWTDNDIISRTNYLANILLEKILK